MLEQEIENRIESKKIKVISATYGEKVDSYIVEWYEDDKYTLEKQVNF